MIRKLREAPYKSFNLLSKSETKVVNAPRRPLSNHPILISHEYLGTLLLKPLLMSLEESVYCATSSSINQSEHLVLVTKAQPEQSKTGYMARGLPFNVNCCVFYVRTWMEAVSQYKQIVRSPYGSYTCQSPFEDVRAGASNFPILFLR